MSKKRDRSKSEECQCPKCQNKSAKTTNGLGNNPFGINPSQLMGMLGNIDMTQLGNILSSMNKDGFDLNNLNLGAVENNMPGMGATNNMNGMNLGQTGQDLSSIKKMMTGMGINDNQVSSIQDMISNMGRFQGGQNNISNKGDINTKNDWIDKKDDNRKNRNEGNTSDVEVDENIEMLMSIKKIVNSDRADFIDRIIEVYNKGGFE